MDNNPVRIAVTPFDTFHDEPLWIRAILEAGWDYVHLRHPAASLRDVKSIIDDIPPRFHGRLRLHGHFELLNEFNLGGIHLNSRCPFAPPLYNGAASRTCHSVQEVIDNSDFFDYMTLSPVFPSLSKPGYSASFTDDELSRLPHGKVIALGGVTPLTVKSLSPYPFKGYAALGYLFQAASIADLKVRLNEFQS